MPDNNDLIFKNVTRFATDEERATVERIDLDTRDLDKFMVMLRQGLIEAAAIHEKAVQENFVLRVESSVRVSRPVFNAKTDQVEELVSDTKVQGSVRGKKVRRKTKAARPKK